MSQSAAERAARINALFDRALAKGKKRGPARLTYQRLADELAAVADDFRGSDRDDISHVIQILTDADAEEGS